MAVSPAALLLRMLQGRRVDPTRTTGIRRAYEREAVKRWRDVKRVVREAIDTRDVFGLKDLATLQRRVGPPIRRAFAFTTDARKVAEFDRWFTDLVNQNVLELESVLEQGGIGNLSPRHWQSAFVRRGYTKGASRALVQMAKLYKGIPASDLIETILASPFHRTRLQSLFTRNFHELQGIGQATAQTLRRELTGGLATGIGPLQIASRLNQRIDKIGITRSRTLARTEIIRANAQGQLATFEQFGVQEVRVQAEFQTVGDNLVCPECASLEGNTYTVEQAREIIPVHPRCFPLNTKVWTVGGRKRIQHIQPGDLVLTHKGLYKPVLQVHKNRIPDADVVTIKLKKRDWKYRTTATSNHPVLMNGKWGEIGAVRVGDRVRHLCNVCQGCGEPILLGRKYCNQKCQWKNPDHRKLVTEKISRTNKEGMYRFHDFEVESVEWKKGKRHTSGEWPNFFNLSVADDESYVVSDGLVAHNCRCNWIPVTSRKKASTSRGGTAIPPKTIKTVKGTPTRLGPLTPPLPSPTKLEKFQEDRKGWLGALGKAKGKNKFPEQVQEGFEAAVYLMAERGFGPKVMTGLKRVLIDRTRDFPTANGWYKGLSNRLAITTRGSKKEVWRITQTIIHEMGHHLDFWHIRPGLATAVRKSKLTTKGEVLFGRMIDEFYAARSDVAKRIGVPLESLDLGENSIRYQLWQIEQKLPVPSSYALTNTQEWIAEGFQTYIRTPRYLKARAPETYKFMEAVANGQAVSGLK